MAPSKGIIRQALESDVEPIVDVHIASWQETYKGLMPDELITIRTVDSRRKYWEGRLKESTMNFVAEVDGQVVGFACFGAIREPLKDYDSEVYAIYLRQAFHGMGLGKGLWQACIDVLRKAGYQKLIVWVLKGNPHSEFYIDGGGQWEAEEAFQIGEYTLIHEAYGWIL